PSRTLPTAGRCRSSPTTPHRHRPPVRVHPWPYRVTSRAESVSRWPFAAGFEIRVVAARDGAVSMTEPGWGRWRGGAAGGVEPLAGWSRWRGGAAVFVHTRIPGVMGACEDGRTRRRGLNLR